MYDDPDDWATGVPVNLSALPESPMVLALENARLVVIHSCGLPPIHGVKWSR